MHGEKGLVCAHTRMCVCVCDLGLKRSKPASQVLLVREGEDPHLEVDGRHTEQVVVDQALLGLPKVVPALCQVSVCQCA